MFGRTRRLRQALADEKNRTAHLRQRLRDTEKERDSWKWDATHTSTSRDNLIIERTRQRDDAMRRLYAAEEQLAATKPPGGPEERRIGCLRRACARYRAELAAQQRTVDWPSRQVLDATGYDDNAIERTPVVSADA